MFKPDRESIFDYERLIEPASKVPMFECLECSSKLVYPVSWDEHMSGIWRVELECPNCENYTEGYFSQSEVDELDNELDWGEKTLEKDLISLTKHNGQADVIKLVRVLEQDALLPEDF